MKNDSLMKFISLTWKDAIYGQKKYIFLIWGQKFSITFAIATCCFEPVVPKAFVTQ